MIITVSGSSTGGNISFLGGYNTNSLQQDGLTIFDGISSPGKNTELHAGIGMVNTSYITLDRLSFYRYKYGIYANSCSNITINDITVGNSVTGINFETCSYCNFVSVSNSTNNWDKSLLQLFWNG